MTSKKRAYELVMQLSPGAMRADNRAATYPGIAKARVDQWLPVLLNAHT